MLKKYFHVATSTGKWTHACGPAGVAVPTCMRIGRQARGTQLHVGQQLHAGQAFFEKARQAYQHTWQTKRVQQAGRAQASGRRPGAVKISDLKQRLDLCQAPFERRVRYCLNPRFVGRRLDYSYYICNIHYKITRPLHIPNKIKSK